MSSIEERVSDRTGEARFRVRFRHQGRNRAVTFATREHAEAWQKKLDAVGPAVALALLEEPADVVRATVTDVVRYHIEHLTDVTRGTRSDYETYLRRRIAPTIGRMPAALLGVEDVERWVQQMSREGLSAKTIKNHHSLLSAALKRAVRRGEILRNVAEGVRLPKADHMQVEMVTLTPAELLRLVELTPDYWRPLVILLAGTGMRFGEATALQVGDIDLDAGTARIRRAWKHTDGNGHELGPPKSRMSRRTLALLGVTEVIRPLCEGRKAGEFVIVNKSGGPVRRSYFHGDVWQPLVERFAAENGKRPRIHDLRHSFASAKIAEGKSMAWLQRQLGHESIDTTNRTYTHLQTADLAQLGSVNDWGMFVQPVRALTT